MADLLHENFEQIIASVGAVDLWYCYG